MFKVKSLYDLLFVFFLLIVCLEKVFNLFGLIIFVFSSVSKDNYMMNISCLVYVKFFCVFVFVWCE